jgi:hypothetical protein
VVKQWMKAGALALVVGLWACGGDDTAGNQTNEAECTVSADCAELQGASCEDGVAVVIFAACIDGGCAVSQTTQECAGGCDGDQCASMFDCDAIACDAPSPTCEGSTRVTFGGGTCDPIEGCVFDRDEEVCDHGCEGGMCVLEICADVVCQDPPPDRCDDHVAVHHVEEGICVDDEGVPSCRYQEIWENCAYVLATCSAGSCQGGIEQTGEATIVEYMAQPNGFFAGAGQWFDVVNTSGAPIDLEGWRMEVSFGLTGDILVHEITNPPAFPTGALLLFAGSSDPVGNGTLAPDYQWDRNEVSIPQFHGWFRLVNADDEIVDFVYIEPGAVMRGHSRVFDPTLAPDALGNDDFRDWCPNLTDGYGGEGNFGRPGAVSSPCVAEPCDGRSCDAPDAICVNDLLSRSYDDTGVTCQVSRFNNPWCDFTVTDEDCTLTGVCVGGTCEEPPADFPEVGELVITELMGDPTGPDPEQEWIEVYNPTDRDLSLFGLRLEDNETGFSFDTYLISDPEAVVPAEDYAVLIRNTDPTLNGNISGGFYYSGGHLKDDPPEGMTILLVRPDGQIVTEVHYGTPTASRSQQLSASLYVGLATVAPEVLLDPASWCDGDGSYGPGGQGTPGDENLECSAE